MGETNGPSEKAQGGASDHPLLREVSPEELQEILEARRKWVESGGKEGKRADLHGTCLTNATGLNRKQVASVFTDEKTRLPDSLKTPGKRSRKVQ